MPKNKRRSLRRELELSIRIYGTDFHGKDFVEDSTTLEVNRNGAKIRLTHHLMPEQEIRILCQGNNREALFRVVRQADEPRGHFSFWGVECLEPDENIWEGAPLGPARKPEPKRSPKPAVKPRPQLDSQLSSQVESPAQVMLRCSGCGMRELVELDEIQVRAMRKFKGLVRGCPACGKTGLWKRVAV